MEIKELIESVNTLLTSATEKTTIDTLASISKGLEEISINQEALNKKNVELTNAYKEALLHSSFKTAETDKDKTTGATTVDFDELLSKYINK